ncbi:MAG: DUF1549 domain-containing protein, partial [Planctomycetes bacterium]|nr:DUF1549 domain-containing protein [Planctomycetota bacterium]
MAPSEIGPASRAHRVPTRMIWPFARPALCGVVFLSVVTTAWLAPAAEKPSAQPGPSGAASSVPWSFQPLQKIEPPADPSGWSVDPVDSFIQEKLRAHNLQPAGPAEKRTLIRRATFDLTGLPPTPEEVEAFLADSSPDAWSKVVDRLLASPRYGEHWGRHWLDVVRYADTGGF